MKAILRSSPDAVSPVVAEILMIAITVVLAAVIFIMASGLLGGRTTIAPVVAFGTIQGYTGGNYNTTFPVAEASQVFSIINYRFNLKVGDVYGIATNFGASGVAATTTVNGTTYRVTWTDADSGGSLTRYDQITVAGNGVSLRPVTTFDFLLIWSDGSTLAEVKWTTP